MGLSVAIVVGVKISNSTPLIQIAIEDYISYHKSQF